MNKGDKGNFSKEGKNNEQSIVLQELEEYKEHSVTGMRFKMAFYNAVQICCAENTPFPYQKMLEQYCIPGKEKYPVDDKYYMIQGEQMIEMGRMLSTAERLLKEQAEKLEGD